MMSHSLIALLRIEVLNNGAMQLTQNSEVNQRVSPS